MHWVKRATRWGVRVVAGLLVLVTALSAIESNEWWVRIWDFPRAQILAGLILAAALGAWFDRRARVAIVAACAVAGAWQVYRIHPYTPLVRPEIALSDATDAARGSCFTLLSLNVLQDNRDYARTIALLRRTDPDIVLLMETDARWARAVAPVLERYPHRLSAPLDNTYGLLFATRLPMADGRIAVIAEKGTPSVHVRLSAAGRLFGLVGLHPRPPVPGQDTEERDAEIALVARQVARSRLPVIATGDFNDVAWSHTSQLFKRIGGYLDPRIGRGTYATFPASMPLLGWPLDHMFVTPEFSVRRMRVREDVGSDHRPIFAELCLRDDARRSARPTPPTREDRRDVGEIVDEYRADQREERAE